MPSRARSTSQPPLERRSRQLEREGSRNRSLSSPAENRSRDLFQHFDNQIQTASSEPFHLFPSDSSASSSHGLDNPMSENSSELHNAEQLRQQLAGWETKLRANENLLAEALQALDKGGVRGRGLISQDIEQRLVDKIDSERELDPTAEGARLPALTTMHGDLYFAKRLETDLEGHLKALRGAKEDMRKVEKKFSTISSTLKEYEALLSEIVKTRDFPLEDFSLQYKDKQRIGVFNDIGLKNAREHIIEIDATMYKTEKILKNVKENIPELENFIDAQSRLVPHLFFNRDDMRWDGGVPEIVQEGNFPGAGGLSAVIKMRGIDVTDEEHIAQTLGVDQSDGSIDLTNLETRLDSLGGGLQLREIESEDLKTALDKGPVVTFLDFPDMPEIDKLGVVLLRIEWNRRTKQDDIIVHDPLSPELYKISFEEFTGDGWTKEVILPRDALASDRVVHRSRGTLLTNISNTYNELLGE